MWTDIITKPADRHNLLRPETDESLFVLFRITEDANIVSGAGKSLRHLRSTHRLIPEDILLWTMPLFFLHKEEIRWRHFFLGKTLKYLYLLDGDINAIPLDEFVLKTEAHLKEIDGYTQINDFEFPFNTLVATAAF